MRIDPGDQTGRARSPSRSTYSTSDQERGVGSTRVEGAGITAGLVVLLVVATVVLAVVAQNVDRVSFELFWWDARVPLAVLLLAVALLTLIVDQVVGVVWRRRRRRMKELKANRSS